MLLLQVQISLITDYCCVAANKDPSVQIIKFSLQRHNGKIFRNIRSQMLCVAT